MFTINYSEVGGCSLLSAAVLPPECGPVLSCSPETGHRGLHHPPATRPPPLASTSPSLTSSHSTPSLSSSRGLSTSCHRPAPGHTRCTVRIFWPRSWPRPDRGQHHYRRHRGGWRMWVNYRKLHLSESSWTFNKVLSASLRQDQWQCGLSPP